MNPRKAKLLEALPKHNWKVGPAAKEAGYSASYAEKQPKQILKSALRAQAKEMLEMTTPASEAKTIDIKRELIETLGLSRQDLYNRLKYIAFDQDKDLASALKVLVPISKDSGLNITSDEAKTIIPVLNIGIREAIAPDSTAQQGHIIEPLTVESIEESHNQ